MNKLAILAAATIARPIAFASAATTAPAPKVEPVFAAGLAKIAMPVRASRRGSESKYPFATLEVGEAFGLKNKTAKNMTSVVSNANRKFQVNKTDDAGNVVYKTNEIKDAQGNVTHIPTSEPVKVAGKHFFAYDVDAATAKTLKGTPLEGSTVLIFRDK